MPKSAEHITIPSDQIPLKGYVLGTVAPRLTPRLVELEPFNRNDNFDALCLALASAQGKRRRVSRKSGEARIKLPEGVKPITRNLAITQNWAWDPYAISFPEWRKETAVERERAQNREWARSNRQKLRQKRREQRAAENPPPEPESQPAAPAPPPQPAAPPPPLVPLATGLGTVRYGKRFAPGANDLTIELYAFLHRLDESTGGLGQFQHFKNIVDMLWNRKDSRRKFIWSPWAEDMIREACANKYLAVAGCASSGKSDTFALWAIVNYLAAPTSTLVILTSTTLREARRRVWKSVEEFWLAVPGLPGKLVSSMGTIRGMNTNGAYWDGTGMVLIPAEKKAEREAIGKLVGIKQNRVLLIADELPELPESIVHAAYTNLTQNPHFQMVGLGNPSSHFDAFGVFAQPVKGWGSISEADYEWETPRGKCIHFDAELCPNVVEGQMIYPWMPTREKIAQIRAEYGEKSLAYYRMVKGFWAPTGVASGIYSEADLVRGVAAQQAHFSGITHRVAGLDPSFSASGDRNIAYFGTVGEDASGKLVLQYDEFIVILADITDKSTPHNLQVARKFIDACRMRGVIPANAAVDSTGAGGPFCDLLSLAWGTDAFLRVHFGGAASALPVSANDQTPAKERYANRMSEIWYVGQELLRSSQLRGIGSELAKEMVSRQYSTIKGAGMRLKVESKAEYRDRTGKSPDIADAAFVLVDLCRARLGLSGNERFSANKGRQNAFRVRMMALDAAAVSGRFLI